MRLRLPSLAPYRLRLVFRGAFLALALATIAMALYVLWEEKQRSYGNYQYSFLKTKEQIAAKLRHPSGQLALLNPPTPDEKATPLHPVLLPFSAIDFDDRHKVRHAMEMAGCLVQYPRHGSICVAIGNDPWAGGFIYAAGTFAGTSLVPHRIGDRSVGAAHRVRVAVSLRGQSYRWIAPFEAMGDAENAKSAGTHGRLTGFTDLGDQAIYTRPLKDFRGWVWQSAECAAPAPVPVEDGDCEKPAFFSLRLPVAVLRDALFQKERPVWPPPDLARIEVRIAVLAPGDGAVLLDSDAAGAMPPFSLNDLAPLLLPGETLRIGKSSGGELLRLDGADARQDESWRFIRRLIRRLPVEVQDAPLAAEEAIATPLGVYFMRLSADARSVDQALSAVATRVSWFVGAMLLAIGLAWLVIDIGIIRRIALLTRRATQLSQTVKATGSAERLDLADLRGTDELGILANCLHDLLHRVKEDVERQKIRAEQEKDLWHAVGHEIMSPLQSLMALHGAADDNPSRRYINRMQQAIRILYGSASPSEAFQSSTLQVQAIDIDEFLRNVAANASCIGIGDVRFTDDKAPLMVRADEYSLEDVVTHVLRNADRFRRPGTAITMSLAAGESTASVLIHNIGPPIPDELVGRIFEYGVSDQPDAGANGNRGQGLFVAKTYMAKMAGTIAAQNVDDGVCFTLTLQRAAGE